MNPAVNERLEAIRAALVAQAAAGRPMPSASKGDEREVFLREFLTKVFPAHFRFGTGSITDSSGAMSGQVDLVAELPFFPSVPVPPADVRLYFAEGVAAAIEVKSDLSGQWGQVENTVRCVRTLKRTTPAGSMWIGREPPATIPVFAVGYTGYATVDGLVDRLERTDTDAKPDGALVLSDPGILVFENVAATGPDALMMFVGLLINNCTGLIASRFDFRPYIDWPPSDDGGTKGSA